MDEFGALNDDNNHYYLQQPTGQQTNQSKELERRPLTRLNGRRWRRRLTIEKEGERQRGSPRGCSSSSGFKWKPPPRMTTTRTIMTNLLNGLVCYSRFFVGCFLPRSSSSSFIVILVVVVGHSVRQLQLQQQPKATTKTRRRQRRGNKSKSISTHFGSAASPLSTERERETHDHHLGQWTCH